MIRRVVVVDHRDSFTWNLVDALDRLGAECVVTPAAGLDVEALERRPPDGLLLSPGPGRPADHPATLAAIRRLGPRVALLGVCLGHQAIAQAFGARIRRATTPVHGRATPIHHRGEGAFRGLRPGFLAARYHSLAVDPESLPDCLGPLAWADDGELMALRHLEAPILGVQFHPESFLSEEGHPFLRNWLESA